MTLAMHIPATRNLPANSAIKITTMLNTNAHISNNVLNSRSRAFD